MIDADDFIIKNKHKYFAAVCSECGCSRGFKRKHQLHGRCRSCAAKSSANPMQGRTHTDRAKFRKHTYDNVDYEDSKISYSKSGNKCIRYRQKCPQCRADVGYRRHIDANRTCMSCQAASRRKYTAEQKRLRSSMKANIGARLRARNLSKNYTSTFSMLPYSFEELVEHLESKFLKDMSWDNYGKDGWEIDHIVPDSWFKYDSYDDPEFLKSWSLNNLQPLWKEDNAKKSNKFKG